MEDATFWGVPQFMWSGVFTLLTTLIAGLIIAYFTSTFLKKKEERTRIAGIIVEKRLSSEQKILNYLETNLVKEEINKENSCFFDEVIGELLERLDIGAPYENAPQYAKVFLTHKNFEEFFTGYEKIFSENRLWLDEKVRKQLVFMQMYFSAINIIPLIVKRIPLPNNQTLSDEQFEIICDRATLLYGISLDSEINYLQAQLDMLIVESIYKLDFDRPKKSVLKRSDLKKQALKIFDKTLLGINREKYLSMIFLLTYVVAGVDTSKISEEELDHTIQQIME